MNYTSLFTTIDPTSHYYSSFGQGSGFPVWNYLSCYGWEKSIYECGKSIYPSSYCSSYQVIGVTCKESEQTKQFSKILFANFYVSSYLYIQFLIEFSLHYYVFVHIPLLSCLDSNYYQVVKTVMSD